MIYNLELHGNKLTNNIHLSTIWNSKSKKDTIIISQVSFFPVNSPNSNLRYRNMCTAGKYDKLMTLERKITRKIFGPTRTDDG